MRKWAWWRNVCHVIFMLLCFCAGAGPGRCSTTVHLSHLNGHTDVITSTSTFTGRGFWDELMCSQDNYYHSLPWRTGPSRARVNAGCGDLPSKQGRNLVPSDDTTQQESLGLVTPSVGIRIFSCVTRPGCLFTAVSDLCLQITLRGISFSIHWSTRR